MWCLQVYSLSDSICRYLSHTNVSCLRLLLLRDYLATFSASWERESWKDFLASVHLHSHRNHVLQIPPYLLLSPNTARDFYHATSTQRGHFDMFPSTLPRLLFVFSHLIKLSIVDMCAPALLFPWLYSWSSISPL